MGAWMRAFDWSETPLGSPISARNQTRRRSWRRSTDCKNQIPSPATSYWLGNRRSLPSFVDAFYNVIGIATHSDPEAAVPGKGTDRALVMPIAGGEGLAAIAFSVSGRRPRICCERS